MSVANKIRAMLNIAEKKPADLANCLEVSVQAVRNKFSRDSFSVNDIIKITDTLGWELQCKSPSGQWIALTIDDIKKPGPANKKQPFTPPGSFPNQPATPSTAASETASLKPRKPFTKEDAEQIDTGKLLNDFQYQLDIATVFGNDVLSALLSKVREQNPGQGSSPIENIANSAATVLSDNEPNTKIKTISFTNETLDEKLNRLRKEHSSQESANATE